MKKFGFTILVAAFLTAIFLSQLKLINRPIRENDEGIYLTTFHLINAGHPAYKQTFFSQLPGFLLTVYPGFVVFGKTLPAARLTIGLWSIIGLLAAIWLGFELKNKFVGLFTIGLLYLMPYYTNQTLTFQSDILISVFSLLSLASFLRFVRLSHLRWFIISIFFLNLAFWTKLDISLIPSLMVILFYSYRKIKKPLSTLFLLALFLCLSSLFFLIFIYPFGISDVFKNSIDLRFQAISHFPSSFFQVIDYLKKDKILSLVIASSLIITMIRKESFRYPAIVMLVWVLSVLILVFIYRPVFPHHLAILSVPFSLFFSYSLFSWAKTQTVSRYISVLSILLIFISIVNSFCSSLKTPVGVLNRQQQKAIDIIQKNTNVNDMVVSDEAILTGISGRYPPPALADISSVRINSGNLSADKFKQIIDSYKPKLIIAWNGRLISIKTFTQVIQNYQPLAVIGNSKIIYLRAQ